MKLDQARRLAPRTLVIVAVSLSVAPARATPGRPFFRCHWTGNGYASYDPRYPSDLFNVISGSDRWTEPQLITSFTGSISRFIGDFEGTVSFQIRSLSDGSVRSFDQRWSDQIRGDKTFLVTSASSTTLGVGSAHIGWERPPGIGNSYQARATFDWQFVYFKAHPMPTP